MRLSPLLLFLLPLFSLHRPLSPSPSVSEQIEGAWRQDPRKGGGGALIDMASHLYDLVEYFAGPIRRITALTGNLVQDYRSERLDHPAGA